MEASSDTLDLLREPWGEGTEDLVQQYLKGNQSLAVLADEIQMPTKFDVLQDPEDLLSTSQVETRSARDRLLMQMGNDR